MRGCVLLTLVIIEIAYLIGGALVFWVLEDYSPAAAKNHESVTVNVTQFIESIEKYVDAEETICINKTQVARLLAQLSTAAESNVSNKWNFGGSIFFAMTVVSTIGYGDFYPTTAASRVFCCIYALIGIPLTLVMMVGIGEKLNKLAARLEERLIRKHPRLGKAGTSIVVICFGALFFLLIPAIVFTEVQGWPFGTAFYYAFVSLTTIGFGDYVAGFPCPPKTKEPWCQLYRISIGVWIFIGLAWVSGLIGSLQASFNATVHQIDENPIIDRYHARKLEHLQTEDHTVPDLQADEQAVQLEDPNNDEDRNETKTV